MHEASEDSEARFEKIRQEDKEEGASKEDSVHETSNDFKPRCPAYLLAVLTDLVCLRGGCTRVRGF
jgi:hypothetical protein